MSNWTSGYVADIGYTFGFYRELTPALLAFTALSAGQTAPNIEGPLTYCELGCGQGFTANVIAAANPHVEVYATDFNPAHVVGARALAARAGSTNVHFSDSSFEEYLEDPTLPDFDIVVLHGIYSWVSAENRAFIVQFLRRKLKPGGLAFVSYNAMPGWAAAAPMRHLMYLYGQTQTGSTASRLEPAIGFVEKLKGANAQYFRANVGLGDRFDRLKDMPRNYLAHEYLNRSWSLFYHSDVADELAEAKLTFMASGHLLDHIHSINLTAEQQTILAETNDPTLRETLRDFLVNQQFRRDLFVRGALALSNREIVDRWRNLRFVLAAARADIPLKVGGALGEAELQPAVYEPVLDALAKGPKLFSQLLDDPTITPMGFRSLREALTILVGAGYVQPCLDAKGDGKRAPRAKAFNLAVMENALVSADLMQLVSPLTGAAVTISRFGQLFLLARQRKATNAVQFAWEALQAQGQLMLKDGAALQTPEENKAELTRLHDIFLEKQLPLLEMQGVA